jgi:hypothetical protein
MGFEDTHPALLSIPYIPFGGRTSGDLPLYFFT